MKLAEILSTPGEHTWRFTQESNCKDIETAMRRVTSKLSSTAKWQHVTVTMEGWMLTDRVEYHSEPVVIMTVHHNG